MSVESRAPRRKKDKAVVVLPPKVSFKEVRVQAPQRRRRSGGRSGSTPFLRSYINTLRDPFEYPAVPLGYDCFLPTSIGSGFIRDTLTVNADGSFALVLAPDLVGMLQTTVVGSGAAHGTAFVSAVNLASIQSNYREARIVSGGIRCFALFPETSAPGVLFAGSAPDYAQADYQAITTDIMSTLPGSRLGVGSSGACATIRPYDNGSFEFFTFPVSGYSSTGIPYMTSTYICGKSFPAGTRVWYEAVLNFEGIARTASAAMGTPSDDVASPTGASAFFPTPGALWNAASRLLNSPIVMDGVGAAASWASGGTIRRGSVRQLFGQGNNPYAFVQQRGRESTVVIEEMKEEAMGYRLAPTIRR